MPQRLLGEPSRQTIGNAGQSSKNSQTEAGAVCGAPTDLEILCDFTHKTLEGKLADEELRRLLVPTNLTKSDGTRTKTMGLLDTTSRLLCGLASCGLGSQLLTRGLACLPVSSSAAMLDIR
jgi:hypothetical protein